MQASDPPPEPPKTCPLCGENLTPGGEFCPKCGAESMRLRVRTSRSPIWFRAEGHFWLVLLVASLAFTLFYRGVERAGMMQTYAMFGGIPVVIGVLVAYMSRPKSGLGNLIKVVTLLLCVVATLLGEGTICILMAAPLFYAFAVLGYYLYAAISKRIKPNRRGGPLAIALIPFVMAMMTADRNHIDNPAVNTVRDEIFVAAPPERVMAVILGGNMVGADFPSFLKLGFPLPKRMEREEDGITRLVFDPRSEPWPGTNTIVSRQTIDPTRRAVRYDILEDGTKLARWLTFRRSGFSVERRPGGTLLRQETVYEQRMQPGFYWNPLENFAMGQMHGYALRSIKRLAEAPKP